MQRHRLKALGFVIAASVITLSCSGHRGGESTLGPLSTRETSVGRVLTDARGMTLYTYKDDPVGGSLCYGRCARNWPPLQAAAGAKPAGDLSLVKRKDGAAQWAYKGKALYTWQKDKRPGDVTGHEFGKAWFVARP